MCAQSIKQTKYETVRDRVNTRENSTLVVATVASTAALVLLTAFDSSQFHCYAFIFAFLGILYREITIFFPDRLDHNYLKSTRFHPSDYDINAGYWNTVARNIRSFIIRLLLVLPLIIFSLFNYNVLYALTVLLLVIPFALEISMMSDC